MALAVLPALVFCGAGAAGVGTTSTDQPPTQAGPHPSAYTRSLPATPRAAATPIVNVDGSLPSSPNPRTLYTVTVPDGPLAIPDTPLAAYHRAAEILASKRAGCHIDWALIASIGRIESHHARGGYVDAQGTTKEPILGPVLDGSGNLAAIPDTDDGRWDGNTTWDRAVGPMQFIPSTWQAYGADANGDGVASPHNIYDAALSAGLYLCADGTDLADPEQLRAAVFRYNHSSSYVTEVLTWARAYRDGVRPKPDSDVPMAVPTTAAVHPAPEPDVPADTASAEPIVLAPVHSAPGSARQTTPTGTRTEQASTTSTTTTSSTSTGSSSTTSTSTTTVTELPATTSAEPAGCVPSEEPASFTTPMSTTPESSTPESSTKGSSTPRPTTSVTPTSSATATTTSTPSASSTPSTSTTEPDTTDEPSLCGSESVSTEPTTAR